MSEPLTDHIDALVSVNVCEPIGSSGNYFRVNEIIRDAIIRDRLNIDQKYRIALDKFVGAFAKSADEDQEALASGIDVPVRMLIPAHFLQTMRQLYNDRNYKDVVTLADRILQNLENFDDHTEQDIRYYLCQSLARISDQRFLHEVQAIKGPEHDFLLGFFYRLQRRFEKALERYRSAMQHQRTEQRARREIVFVLMTIEDFESAISLARDNYERYPRNPFLAQAYFNCLLHQTEEKNSKEELKKVLGSLNQIAGARASEMHANMAARFEFEFGDKAKAYQMIDSAIHQHKDVIFPLLTKMELAIYDDNAILISETIAELKRRNLATGHKMVLAKAEAVLAALSGDPERGLRMLGKELSQLSDKAKDKLARKLRKSG